MADPEDHDALQGLGALALVGQVGLAVAAPIVAGVVGGLFLDRFLGGTGLMLVPAILLGIAAGIVGAYRVIVTHLD